MTTSFREEIKTLVISALCRQIDISYSESDFYTNEIISIFEKRIDSQIKEYEQNPFAESDEVISAFQDFKKEMLK